VQATPPDVSLRARLALPIALTAISLVVVDATAVVLPGGGAFLLLLVPVAVTTLVLGPRGGLTALVVGAIGAVILAAAREHPWLAQPSDIVRVAAYLVVGGIVIGIMALPLRRTSGGWRSGTLPLDAASTGLVEPLTAREIEVLRLVADGFRVEEVGHRLFVSRNTVKSHLNHAYGKLGAHNRAEAIAAGLRTGYLRADDLGR
jgi:DNA-binding CsgD family transcriptional regulator